MYCMHKELSIYINSTDLANFSSVMEYAMEYAMEYTKVIVIQGEAIWLQNLTYPGKVVIEIIWI